MITVSHVLVCPQGFAGILPAALEAPPAVQWLVGIVVVLATLLYWEQLRFKLARWAQCVG